MARLVEETEEKNLVTSTSTCTFTAECRHVAAFNRSKRASIWQDSQSGTARPRDGPTRTSQRVQSDQSSKKQSSDSQVEKILDCPIQSIQSIQSVKESNLFNSKLIRNGSTFGGLVCSILLLLSSFHSVLALPSPSTSTSPNRHHSHLSNLLSSNGNRDLGKRDQKSFIVDDSWRNGLNMANTGENQHPSHQAMGKKKGKEWMDQNQNQDGDGDGIAGDSTSIDSQERPTKRWGHSSIFLNGSISEGRQELLFIGGQVDGKGQITNDVWSLDLTELTTSTDSNSSSTSLKSSRRDSNQFLRRSSSNLPPTSYSSSVLLPGSTQSNGEDEIWLIGGLTMDCTKDSSIQIWKNSTGWKAVEGISEAPLRRKGANAFLVPKSLGLGEKKSNGKDAEAMDGIMNLGGISDQSTCFQPSSNVDPSSKTPPSQVNYFGLDIWSLRSSSNSSKSSSNATASSRTPTSRSLSLDSRMKTISLVDSSTVLIPNHSNSSSNDPRIAFVGGKTQTGNLAPLDHFWVLELNSGKWERWVTIASNSSTAGSNSSSIKRDDDSGIPKGRYGHSTTLTSSGKIVLFGGYLNDSKVPSSELWSLDIEKNPAEWSRLDLDLDRGTGSGIKPRAFHTADMVQDVMIVAFGDDGTATETNKRDGDEDTVAFLDTQDQDPKNWKWSKDVRGVLNGRGSKSSNAAQSSSMASSAESSSASANHESSYSTNGSGNGNQVDGNSGDKVGAAASDSSNDTSSSSDCSPNQAQGSSATPGNKGDSSAHQHSSHSVDTDSNSQVSAKPDSDSNESPKDSKPSPSDNEGGSDGSESQGHGNEQKKSGAIAGSVLGAAALLGTMGGLYAYKKRRDSNYETSGDFDSRFGFVDGGKKHGVEPVSNLWLTTPVAWASKGLKRRASETSSLGNSISEFLFRKNDSKGAGRRGSNGSNLTQETLWEKDDIYTTPSQPPKAALVSMNNLGKSSNSKGISMFRRVSSVRNHGDPTNKKRSLSSSLIGRTGRTPLEDSEAQLNDLNDSNQRKVSQGFISSIIQDDDEKRTPPTARYVSPDLPRPMRSGFFSQQKRDCFPSPPIAAAMLTPQNERISRAPSCESLGGHSSDGSASHCSYPFLSAMHRPSLANLTGISSSSEASISRENLVQESDSDRETTSPREKMLRQMVKAMRREVDLENSTPSLAMDLENGRNQILNPFNTPQEEDDDDLIVGPSTSEDEEGIKSHLKEESELLQAHKRAMESRNLKSPSDQTEFDSDREEEFPPTKKFQTKRPLDGKKIKNSSTSSSTPIPRNPNFQTPIFGWEPIRSPKVAMNGPYPNATSGNGPSNRGKRLGAALLFSSGNKNLLQSSTADLSPRDPIKSPHSRNHDSNPSSWDQEGNSLSVAAERAEMLIEMDNHPRVVKEEQKRKSEKRARKSLLRVTNES